jgi:hypothetical protein
MADYLSLGICSILVIRPVHVDLRLQAATGVELTAR